MFKNVLLVKIYEKIIRLNHYLLKSFLLSFWYAQIKERIVLCLHGYIKNCKSILDFN